MPVAHLNIGSNIGDRHALIEQAVAAVRRSLDPDLKVSAPFYSSPMGFDSPNSFINVGVRLWSELLPFDLLRAIQEIERTIDPSPHRDSLGNYIDRKIDIDLICYGRWIIRSPFLNLPHPLMFRRPFVMKPLLELEPDFNRDFYSMSMFACR